MEMRAKHLNALPMLLILAMLLAVFSTATFAEDNLSVEIPVTVTVSGSPPTNDEDFKINLKAANPAYPMPVGSEDGVYSMIIKGAKKVILPKIKFSSLGIYTYTINQSPGSNKLATYDDTEYNLVVYVTNAEEGSGFETTVILYLIGETGKFDEVIFNNKYKAIPPPIEDPPIEEPPEEEEPETPDPGEEEPESPDPEEEEPETPEPEEEDPKTPDPGEEEPESPAPEEEEPKSPEPSKPAVPQTSDETVLWPYIGLFISGATILSILGVTVRKRKTEN